MRPNDMPRPFAPDHSDGDDLVRRLASIAAEARAYGYAAFADEADNALGEIERLRAELSEAKRRASNAEFELNCLEQVRLRDNQYLIDRAEKAERELAALRERIEKAPVATVGDLHSDLGDDVGFTEIVGNCDELFVLEGKRVRLVEES